jgi:ribonuclease HII
MLGLSESLRTATRRALEQISVPYHEIIIDGTVNFLEGTGKGDYVTTMKKADLLIGAVSAASIVAKVARDDYMAEQDERYPGYGFGSHVGYGTALHRAAIERLGITPLHRRSFAPIRDRLGSVGVNGPKADTSTAIGSAAEDAAADWLAHEGVRVVDRNWKTKFCEIDIIAEKDGGLHFIEVKHRASSDQGGGLAAITPVKLRQMRFAATLYLTKHPDVDARLYVLTSSGRSEAVIDELLPLE